MFQAVTYASAELQDDISSWLTEWGQGLAAMLFMLLAISPLRRKLLPQLS